MPNPTTEKKRTYPSYDSERRKSQPLYQKNLSEHKCASGEKLTECVCPKCKKLHKVRMFWTGRGVPKKYCEPCKAIAEVLTDQYRIMYGGER